MQMQVIEASGSYTHIALDGRLDFAGTQEIETQFTAKIAAQRKDAMIDMTQVSFIASMGMRLILSTAKALGQHQHRMLLVNPQPMVREALSITGICKIVPIVDSVDDAKAQLAPAGN